MSSNLLIARKKQTTREHVYDSASCGECFWSCAPVEQCKIRNGVRDPIVGSVDCCLGCKPQHQCGAPDRNECFIGLNSQGRDPLISCEWDIVVPNLKCVYDLTMIDQPDQLVKYREQFSNDYTNTAYSQFCDAEVTTCTDDVNSCSRYRSINQDGDLCRDWLSTLSLRKQDAAMENYCIHHNSLDCRCINRSTDKEYMRAKAVAPFPDKCWFIPCANAESLYLVPTKTEDANDHCPVNICQQIIQISDAQKVDIDSVSNNINCNFVKEDNVPVKPVVPKWIKYSLLSIFLVCVAIILFFLLRYSMNN
jgi:hypothetical protein